MQYFQKIYKISLGRVIWEHSASSESCNSDICNVNIVVNIDLHTIECFVYFVLFAHVGIGMVVKPRKIYTSNLLW